jgi:hypothetical protein
MLNEQHKAKKLKSEKQRMRDNCAKAADTITLNLRGKVFKTYNGTLLEGRDLLLYPGEWLPDEKGEYFIDRGLQDSIASSTEQV